MTAQVQSEIYRFKGQGIENKECGLTILELPDKVVLLFSDLGDATSVTDAIPQLATEIYLERYKTLSPDKVVVVEHNGEINPSLFKQQLAQKHNLIYAPRSDELHLVTLKWDGQAYVSPRWKKLKSPQIDQLLPFLCNQSERK
ncbi:MAG: hypothetical protein OEZ68_17860 [Gammaproteobacteria bacterium]|nr:hypothetical protein [Gammaproteobacteria bacterium]MDH5802670.1 hypothetical protein [Gammaproteobacteria bacterium]